MFYFVGDSFKTRRHFVILLNEIEVLNNALTKR